MKMEEKAKKYYGTTDAFGIAGYMLKDGTMLDFSEGGNFRQDHANICNFFRYSDNNGNYSRFVYKFMRRGNIRLCPESSGFEFTEIPTQMQYQALRSINKDYGIRLVERYSRKRTHRVFNGFRDFEDYIREKVTYQVGYSLE